MSTIIKSARLIFVSVSNNNNKFYYLDLFDNDQVQIRYGRYIEENGELKTQSDTQSAGGEGLFNRKLREKTNKGYKPQPVLEDNASTPSSGQKNAGLEEIALSQIRTQSDEVRALISYLCNINIHNIVENSAIKYNVVTGLFSTPSGLITLNGIRDGRELLSKIKNKVDKEKWDAHYIKLLDQYLTIVPRDFGRKRPDPKELFPDDAEIQKQAGILDSLEASLTSFEEKRAKGELETEGDDAPPPPPQLFDTAVELLTDQAEFDRIKEQFEKSAKTEHQSIKHLTLKRVYTVEIAKMKREYNERGAAKGNVHPFVARHVSRQRFVDFQERFHADAAIERAHRWQSVRQRVVFRARLDQKSAIRWRVLGRQTESQNLYVSQRHRGRQSVRAENHDEFQSTRRLRFVLGQSRQSGLAD